MGVVLPFDPAAGIIAPGGPQTRNPRYFAVPQGLVGYWGFDPDSLDFTANLALDLSGNANNGTLVGVTADQGPVGGALLFAGAFTSRVSSMTLPGMVNTVPKSMTMWINSTSTARQGLAGTRNGASVGWAFEINRTTAGNLTYQVAGGSAIEFAAAIAINNWFFVAFTVDAAGLCTLYSNGVAIGSGTLGAGGSDATSGVIGNESIVAGGNSFPVAGRMDDVRSYNRTLDPGEVQQLYQAGLSGRRDAGAWLPGDADLPMLMDNVLAFPGTRHQRQAHGATTRCRAQRRAGARCRRRRRWADGAAHEE